MLAWNLSLILAGIRRTVCFCEKGRWARTYLPRRWRLPPGLPFSSLLGCQPLASHFLSAQNYEWEIRCLLPTFSASWAEKKSLIRTCPFREKLRLPQKNKEVSRKRADGSPRRTRLSPRRRCGRWPRWKNEWRSYWWPADGNIVSCWLWISQHDPPTYETTRQLIGLMYLL